MIDVDHGATSFVYNEIDEKKLKYSLINSFQPTQEDGFKFDQYQQELLNKLEDSHKSVQQYSITNKGIILEKGQEIGCFNLGSSILLLFESPKGSEFNVEEGQKVKLGNRLIKTHAK